jgi:hypothetical protein
MKTECKFFKDLLPNNKFVYGNNKQMFIKLNETMAQAINEKGNLSYQRVFCSWSIVDVEISN